MRPPESNDRQISDELLAAEVDVRRITELAVAELCECPGVEAAWVVRVDLRRTREVASSPAGGRLEGLDPVDYPSMIALPGGGTVRAADLPGHPLEQVVGRMLDDGGEWVGYSLLRCGEEQLGILAARGGGEIDAGGLRSRLDELAVQTSLAIRTDRIQEHLARQRASLDRTFDAHRRLHEAAAGGDFAAVVQELSAVLDRGLELEQIQAEPHRVTVGSVVGEAVQEVPVTLSRRRVGQLSAFGERKMGKIEGNLLREGTELISLALAKQQSITEVEGRLRGELLEALIDGTGPSSPSTVTRARRLGIDLSQPHRILVVEVRTLAVEPATLTRALTGCGMTERSGVLFVERGGRIVVAVIGEPERAAAIGRRLLEAAGDEAGIAIGLSSTNREFAQSLREALSCANLALRGTSSSAIVDHRSLGPLRFMLDAPDVDSSARLVQETLGPLAAYDAERDGALMETLRIFLEESGRQAVIAERCHIHLNTVKYRMARIGELLNVDLADADSRFRLWLALRLLDLFTLIGTDLLTPSAPAPELVISHP